MEGMSYNARGSNRTRNHRRGTGVQRVVTGVRIPTWRRGVLVERATGVLFQERVDNAF